MSMITIRKLEPETKRRLRIRAARNSRSMEAEAREILREALSTGDDDAVGLGTWISRQVWVGAGVELDLPPREGLREPPVFE
jgi:plasmid stability protein